MVWAKGANASYHECACFPDRRCLLTRLKLRERFLKDARYRQDTV